ncbi:carbohydrate ABC transporter permease [Paenibacillus nasutitermitis]|uniref:ABC transporter permease n=1 Tax=Paenibacillus nasutitermitis TaxID=1652958 RepID=A0A916Z9J3_9BACL|nr:sugar ABC transporter permease [Paenibacillus nasutitermitis]GGD82974.1 ABC transporter permease [Paenibacillus nasutitermitis]
MHKQGYWGYIFTLPFIINVIVFVLFPIVFSAYISFTQWDLFNAPKWVGADNWIRTLKQEQFWVSVRNVLYFSAIFVPLQTLIAFVAAYLLNLSIRGKTFFRLLYFMPVVTPWIAGGLIWVWLYNYQYGLINWGLEAIGIAPVKWLDSQHWWVVIGSVALTNVWKGVGSSMIMLLAGMQNVPKEMLEASQIDGATGWKQLTRIVFPMVSPMIYLVMILSTISSFQTFDVFLGMFGSFVAGIPDRNMVPNLLIYRDAFLLFKMGPASATAWLLFVIILSITLFQRYFEKRWVHYD